MEKLIYTVQPYLMQQSFGWDTMYFDLTTYAGKTALLSFRYMTDWGTENPG